MVPRPREEEKAHVVEPVQVEVWERTRPELRQRHHRVSLMTGRDLDGKNAASKAKHLTAVNISSNKVER